jgi:hypothetical protein
MQVRRFVLVALGAGFVLAAAAPAYADPYDRNRHEWREHQSREHEWREHEWREHQGYYGQMPLHHRPDVVPFTIRQLPAARIARIKHDR